MDDRTKKIVTIGGIIVILIIIILLFKGCSSRENVGLALVGDEVMVLHQNTPYVDPGYEIIGTNNIYNYYVNIEGYVNTNKMGSYPLTYVLYDNNGELLAQISRQVIVLNDGLTNVTMTLKGEEDEYYFAGDYIDNGIEVYNNDLDISDQVIIDSNVNTDEIGEYTVRYQIVNGSDYKETIRKVHVVDYIVERRIDEIDKIIDLVINVDGFSHVILPDGTEVSTNQLSYIYNLPGTYQFDIYLKSGSHKIYQVEVIEQEKEEPTPTTNPSVPNVKLSGSCTLVSQNNKTRVTVNINKPSEVTRYIANGKTYRTSPFTITGTVSKITIIAFNKANKPYSIKCERKEPVFDTGFKPVNYSKIRWYPCGNDISQANQDLQNIIKTYGAGSRAAVAMAATYLANYKYDIQYYWAGKYDQLGFNPSWGCPTNYFEQQICSVKIGSTQCQMGLDCTGFTKWAYINGGFPANIIPRSGQESAAWGDFAASKHLYQFGNSQATAYIKPGDLVAVPNSHVGIVIGVDGSRVQIAHESGGIKITTVLKSTGKSIDGNGDFTHFVLMDEFYKTYGKG